MLTKPIKGMVYADITQFFHESHKALDIVHESPVLASGYGTPLCAPERCIVIQLSGETFSPGLGTYDLADIHGYGVFLKGLETGYTHLFWHTFTYFPVKNGDIVNRGQVVAFMGNYGDVYSQGVAVPIEDRLEPNRPGTHLHWEVMDTSYVLGDPKPLLDPLPLINWTVDPAYTDAELVEAIRTVALKEEAALHRST